MDTTFLAGGKLAAGCNYWASHAGIYMWRNWSAETVEQDFQAIAGSGMTYVRVFPMWEDFQPVELLYTASGNSYKAVDSVTGRLLDAGEDGLDPEMLSKFRVLADLAHKYELKLIVGLLTGWMSGRLFVPRILTGRNLFTDPEALRWEKRFIRGFVSAFKDHPAIAAWEPGNECNCLSMTTRDSSGGAVAWHWLDFITSSIRSIDPVRPVWSGMHGTKAEPQLPWNLMDQGELCDGLTTHPYPLFTEGSGKSPINTIPAVLHSTAETVFYRGLAGKPAMIEEIGTLGPCIASEERRCAYVRTSMISAFAHDCLAYIWWCAFDQGHLDYAPYTCTAIERELGLYAADRTPHPALHVMTEVLERIKALPVETLPPRKVDALVVTTEEQNQWLTAYGAFTLAKQAGIEIEFAPVCRPLPEADFYWLPAVGGSRNMTLARYRELIGHVKNGSTMLVTDSGSAVLQPFAEVFGCRIDSFFRRSDSCDMLLDGERFPFRRDAGHRLLPGDAEVLAYLDDGTPALTCFRLGKGRVFFLNGAPELQVLDEKAPHYYKIFRFIARKAGIELPDKDPGIGRTVHALPDGRKLVIEINHTDKEIDGIPANDFRFSGI